MRCQSRGGLVMAKEDAGVIKQNEWLFDLLGWYRNYYWDLHNKNTTEYFDSLVRLSNIDIEQNRETNKEIRETVARINALNRHIKKRNAVKTLLIIMIILSALVVLGQLFQMFQAEPELLEILVVIAGAAFMGLFIYILARISSKTRQSSESKKQLERTAEKLTEKAWEQMRPLNELFTARMSPELFNKTLPYINLDKVFSSKRLDFLERGFGFCRAQDYNRSALYVQSGDIYGNPFFICTDLVHEMGTKTYTGSIVIHWTTTEYSDGKPVTRHHSEVLTASVQKPCPYYREESYLVYANEAAPDLIFSRRDSDAEHMSEKQIEKHVSKKEKKLKKQADRNMSGSGFTVMGNTEFEVLFGAVDRNNEVQFRLLFTPLAQTQLLQLMKDKETGFGDDISFYKHRMINYIYPQHLQRFRLNITPVYCYSYDFDVIRERFISYNNDFFKHLYFTFAPILAIPICQQQKPREFIYRDLYDSYACYFEHEYVANNISDYPLAHPKSETSNILKTTVLHSEGKCDTVRVTAFGYRTIKRVDYVKKLGGDGCIHLVPVEWIEYIPVYKHTDIEISALDEAKELSYAEKVRQAVKDIKDKKIDRKNICRLGGFSAYING